MRDEKRRGREDQTSRPLFLPLAKSAEEEGEAFRRWLGACTVLGGLYKVLAALPAVSVDHLGLSKAGFPDLLKLVEKGVRVKATGFGRVDFDVREALREIHAANPQALLFGTDLPSTRAPRPYEDTDALLVVETLGEEGAARVLYDNAVEFYRAPRTP